ncbi:hypothetical protein F3Y22_tig00011547pilonHSYRG00026 [Hibiscus syriacus]|uniref:Integrase catalytic domain-containing protein n=1 Tax=Hibiscus syriacus TaxID=106335 RepID=A0A6A3C8T4_HIBSY|nr:hypothetical protein F3Y22_tig00011547pilonHSYRG00026 [Hibiscus syriacus]
MPDSFVAVEAISEGSSATAANNRMQVLLMIQGHELEHLLDESLSVPPQTIVDESGELILVGAHTSAKIWNTVLSMFSKLSTTKIMSLHGRLRSLKIGDLSVREFSTQIKEICDLLATSGSSISKIDKIVTLLNGLPGNFEPFVAAIIVSREPYTFDIVTLVLIDAESRIGDLMKTAVSINLTRHNNYNGGNANGNRDRYYTSNRTNDSREKTQNVNKYKGRPRHQCQLCGKIGHLVDRCWHRFDENFKGVASRQSRDTNEMQANVCKYDANDSSYNPFVHTAAGDEVVAEDATTDIVQINSLIAKGVLSAADKWYPDSGATHHTTYDKAGASLGRPYSGKDKCFVKDEETGRIQLESKPENGLYCFNKTACMDGMLHQLGKSHRLPFLQSNTVYSRLFELVEIDVWGPASIKSGGWQYYVSFIDMFSRNVWVYLMRNKSDITQAFNLFHALVKNQFKTNIVALQTDGGGEYRGLEQCLAAAGIKHRVTCPHTSQQNGVVERKHQHIIDTSLTLLAQSAIPFKYWSYVVLIAVYLINRLPADLLGGISPFEKLYGKKPDYQFLRVFGCQCFPCLRPFNRHKFDFMSKPCVFLGYSSQHHGYQCLDESELSMTDHEDIGCDNLVNIHDLVDDAMVDSSHTPGVNADHDDRANTMEDEPDAVSRVVVQLEDTHSELTHSSATPNDDQNGSISVQEPGASSRTVSDAAQHVTNKHHMVTRSKAGIFKPKVYNALFNDTPLSVQDALQHKHWRTVVEMEFKALTDNNTWKLVPLSADRKAIGCKWLFRIKHNSDGSINRFKASHVVRFFTINVLLSVVALRGWQVYQVDVNNAFLKGNLQEEVYMVQPEWFEQTGEHGEKLVCKLQKALYGLRQAPRNWYKKLQQCLCDMGFRPSRADSSLFICGTKHDITYVAVYVDDILVTGSSEKCVNEVKKQLHDSQKKYVQELLTKFNVHAKPVDTPLPITPKLSSENAGAPINAQQYRSAVGALLYVCHTRPDIAFAVHKVAQFMKSTCEAHWTGVKRILRYLKDADWGSDLDDRRSVSGYCVYLGSHLLSWSSRKQRPVSRSTAKAEYRSLADTTVEVLRVKAVLDDMNVELSQAPVIWCDNTSTVAMAANPVLHAKVKHEDLDVHFVREKEAISVAILTGGVLLSFNKKHFGDDDKQLLSRLFSQLESLKEDGKLKQSEPEEVNSRKGDDDKAEAKSENGSEFSEASLLLKVKDGFSYPFSSFGSWLVNKVKRPTKQHNHVIEHSDHSVQIPELPHVEFPHLRSSGEGH